MGTVVMWIAGEEGDSLLVCEAAGAMGMAGSRS